MASHASRVLQFVADEIEDPDFAENLRIYFNLPKMVQEITLSDRVSRHHFLQWDPRVFSPGQGSILRTVSFRQGRKNYRSKIYLFVSVVFFIDNRMREGEPRVWRELIAAWDATFGLADLRPNVHGRRYGSLTDPAISWSDKSPSAPGPPAPLKPAPALAAGRGRAKQQATAKPPRYVRTESVPALAQAAVTTSTKRRRGNSSCKLSETTGHVLLGQVGLNKLFPKSYVARKPCMNATVEMTLSQAMHVVRRIEFMFFSFITYMKIQLLLHYYKSLYIAI